eukprot:Hpha_TRINITY_DN16520_c0_g7::TRINITY_DN16520_c0_g7_i1::g.132797::m.132797
MEENAVKTASPSGSVGINRVHEINECDRSQLQSPIGAGVNQRGPCLTTPVALGDAPALNSAIPGAVGARPMLAGIVYTSSTPGDRDEATTQAPDFCLPVNSLAPLIAEMQLMRQELNSLGTGLHDRLRLIEHRLDTKSPKHGQFAALRSYSRSLPSAGRVTTDTMTSDQPNKFVSSSAPGNGAVPGLGLVRNASAAAVSVSVPLNPTWNDSEAAYLSGKEREKDGACELSQSSAVSSWAGAVDVDDSEKEETGMTQRLREIFALMDKDETGVISTDEIHPLLPANIGDNNLARVLHESGAKDGQVDLTSFLRFFTSLLEEFPQIQDALHARVQLVGVIRRSSGSSLKKIADDPTPQPRNDDGLGGFQTFIDRSVQEQRGVFLVDAWWRQILHSFLLLLVAVDSADIFFSISSVGWYSEMENPPRILAGLWCIFTGFAFGVESVLCTRTACLKNWTVIDDIRSIGRHYFRTWMVFDVLMALPFDCIFGFTGMWTAFRVLRVPKLLRLVRVPSLLFPIMSPSAIRSKFVTALMFSFWFSIVVLICSVLWLVVHGKQCGAFCDMTAAVYFVLTTITTVGYGDILPSTEGEQWFVMGLQLSSTAFSCFMGAQATAFLLETTPEAEVLKDRRKRMTALFRAYQIPWQLQAQCFAVLPSLADQSYGQVLGELPSWMADQIECFARVRALRRVPLFGGADTDTLVEISKELRRDVVGPGKDIVRADEPGNDMYIIMSGCCEVTLTDGDGTEILLATLRDGNWFGEQSLLHDTCRAVNVRTISACTLWSLDKESFLSVAARSESVGKMLEEQLAGKEDFWGSPRDLTLEELQSVGLPQRRASWVADNASVVTDNTNPLVSLQARPAGARRGSAASDRGPPSGLLGLSGYSTRRSEAVEADARTFSTRSMRTPLFSSPATRMTARRMVTGTTVASSQDESGTNDVLELIQSQIKGGFNIDALPPLSPRAGHAGRHNSERSGERRWEAASQVSQHSRRRFDSPTPSIDSHILRKGSERGRSERGGERGGARTPPERPGVRTPPGRT